MTARTVTVTTKSGKSTMYIKNIEVPKKEIKSHKEDQNGKFFNSKH